MTKTQIACFLAVAQSQSFTKAANMLYISQPAISKSVAALETELGIRLLERRDNLLSLTHAGSLMYDFFIRVEGEYKALLEEIEHINGMLTTPVKIGCPDTWNPSFFYSKIKNFFHTTYPDIKLSIECCKLSDLIIQLKSSKLDIVLTHDFYSPYQYGISSKKLTTTGCGILYSKEYFHNIHSPEDFRDTCFLLYDNDIQKKFEGIIKDACSNLFTPVVKNVGQLSKALFDLACGKGVMLFTDWDSVLTNTEYGYLPLKQQIPITIIYSTEGLSTPVKLFIDKAPEIFL